MDNIIQILLIDADILGIDVKLQFNFSLKIPPDSCSAANLEIPDKRLSKLRLRKKI